MKRATHTKIMIVESSFGSNVFVSEGVDAEELTDSPKQCLA